MDPNDYRPYFDPSQFPNQPIRPVVNQPQGYRVGGFQAFTQGGFTNFHQGGFQNTQPGSGPEMDFVAHTHPERDVVPETQPGQKTKAKKKGKSLAQGEGSRQGPMQPKPWTTEEETVLATVFIDLSENPEKGNAQRRTQFWMSITKKWHELMGLDEGYRTDSQLNSKWKDLKAKVSKWCAIYNNCMEQRRSGMSDADVLARAEEEYRVKSNGQVFAHKHVWNVVKGSPKWQPPPLEPSQGSTKRSKGHEDYSPGTSDARTSLYADLGLDDDEDDEYVNRELERPGGRDKAKRERSVSRQTSSSSTLADKFDAFNTLAERLKMKQEEYERRAAERAEKAKEKAEIALREDLKLMMMSDDHLTGEQRDVVQKMEEILKKYR